MASSRSWIYDVFISFRGQDVRTSFLSHLLKELDRKSVKAFLDTDINRNHPIGPELMSAVKESRISIVVLSRNYASSVWLLNELVEILECSKEYDQIVMPVFYGVDPSEVRKQTGEFGKNFRKAAMYKNKDARQTWISALVYVANRIGVHSENWSDEAAMIEFISKDVSNQLFTPSDDFAEYVGIETHIDAIMSSKLCLESGGVRMVGILGPSGIGKTTIASALYSRISSQFDYRTFGSYKRTHDKKIADFSVKLIWVKQFLTDILGHNDKRIESLGVVKQCLKHKQVLVVLDDVDDLEVLKTLVGQTSWFGFGSRIIVITKDRELLKSHMIDSIYEVDFPSRSWKFDVFPSFSGENVRKSFLSHLLKELNRRSVNTFIDNAIDRSRPIGPELISAIKGSRISIVVFSKNYASSTWCLDELVEIYKCFIEFEQMVIPIFYKVDPSHVSDQTGKFGKAFDETCKGKTEEDKQRWKKALDEVAKMAGYDSHNWSDEATMIEEISKDMSNKLSYYPTR